MSFFQHKFLFIFLKQPFSNLEEIIIINKYPFDIDRYNQSIYCWNVYIKRLGQIICMSVVDLKPQPLYEDPINLIDGLCFTYPLFFASFLFFIC